MKEYLQRRQNQYASIAEPKKLRKSFPLSILEDRLINVQMLQTVLHALQVPVDAVYNG